MKSFFNNSTKLHRIFILIVVVIFGISSSGCIITTFMNYVESGGLRNGVAFVEYMSRVNPSSDLSTDPEAYLGEEEAIPPGQTGVESSANDSGDLKPVGFVNYGEFDASVRAQTYIPLGSTEPGILPNASTVSTANDGIGNWPNSSRYLQVPMGTYSWCIDWEEGDLDDDGQIDYFHYIQNDPTVLDEEDSDELEFAEEVAISAPPSSGAIYEGKCKAYLADSPCESYNSEVNVYSIYVMEQANPPEIRVAANAADQAPPGGISIASGGVSTGYGGGMILWQEGDWVEASTSDSYQSIGVQVHGDQTIGWARVLFDGQEIWRGDASTYVIAEGRYGVYVEVRCFPTGSHTLRIEGLGIRGSGEGSSIPVSYFAFGE